MPIVNSTSLTMLHFELYSGQAGLDIAANLMASGTYPSRSDLVDPLAILSE